MAIQASDISNLLEGILANAIFLGCCWLAKWLSRTLKKRARFHRELLFVVLVLLWIFLDALLYRHLNGRIYLFASILLFMIAAFFSWGELRQFWRLGLIGADRQISEGIDFKRSLDLCTNSLEFLGVGASKLTKEKYAFEDAIERCHRSHTPIRFLLSNPANQQLQHIAKQAGRDPKEYQRAVKESLRFIAAQKRDRSRNIEVRFYRRLPIFRLMFIDGWLCLASHYVFGEGEGAQCPQLYVKKTNNQRDVDSLYEPFRRYFEELWAEATVWDFASHLEN